MSPDPVTMYLSSFEMSLHKTDDDSLDYNRNKKLELMLMKCAKADSSSGSVV